MLSKSKLLVVLVIAVALVGSAATAIGSGLINVVNPQTASGVPPLAPPPLIPPGELNYEQLQPGSNIVARDGRPIARLAVTPSGLSAGLAVSAPEIRSAVPPENPTGDWYTILATVRYTGSGHTVVVTTARPSVSVAQQQVYLGDPVELVPGSMAYVRNGVRGSLPIQVVVIKGDLIVTVAGDLPIDRIKAMAAQVTIK